MNTCERPLEWQNEVAVGFLFDRQTDLILLFFKVTVFLKNFRSRQKTLYSCIHLGASYNLSYFLLFPLRLRILRTLRAPVHWFAVHAAILFLSRLLYDFSVGRARILVPCRLVAIPKLSSTIKHVKAMAKINKVVFSILESLCYLD